MISNKQLIDESTSFFSSRETHSFYSDSSSKVDVKKFIKEFSEKEKDNFTHQFRRLLEESDFEYGFSSPAEHYVKTALKNFGVFAREWITEIFVQNIDDEYITSSILRVLMHLDCEDLEPQGITILLAALNHKSAIVREDVIRTFENWENPKHASILKNLKCDEPRLQNMLDEVIDYLESL